VADEAVGVGQLRCGADLLIRGVQLAVADVVGHGAGEQMGILQHNAQRTAQGVLCDVLHVDAVVGDNTLLHVVEAVDEVGDGGLARTGRAHKGDLLPGLGEQGHIVEHRLFPIVGEGHVVKAHVAPQLHQRAVRLFPGPVAGAPLRLRQGIAVFLHADDDGLALIGLGLFVHDGEDALGAGRRGQQGVDLLADLAHRLAHLLDVQQVRAQRADVKYAADGQQAAHAAGDGVVDLAEVAHGGHHHAGIGLGSGGGVAVVAVEGGKALHGLALVVEYLDDLLAFDHLLDIAVQRAQRRLLPLEIGTAAAADDLHHQPHQAQEQESDQRQPRVQHDHHHHGAHKGQHVGDDAGEAAVQHLRHGVDVVGEAAHQVAGLVAVIVADGQLLQPVEQVLPQGGHRVLCHVDHDAGVGKGAQ